MRSLYVRILAASFATLLVALLAFVVVFLSFSAPATNDYFRRVQALQVEDAVQALRQGGPAEADRYLARLNRGMGATHYLVDEAGRDVVSGADRSALLGSNRFALGPRRAGGRLVIVAPSAASTFRLIVVAPPPPFDIWSFLPYYVLILAAVALLGWLLAVGIVSPLRQVAFAVDRFGRGDLSARVRLNRRDEIGTLAHSFDEMADRIQQLLAAERQLLQDVSHELRSPLARLSVAIELSRTAADRDAANRLQKEVDRLTTLVGMLLQMTRAEGDPISRRSAPVDLSVVVRDVVESCALEAQAHDCRIALGATQPNTVQGDIELLRRAFENILRNAIRYAPAGSEIQVACDDGPAGATLSVRDFGPGVPEELLPRLTDPFFRVDVARDTKSGGVGLGLTIARRALLLHRGTLTMDNMHPGLRVTLTVPHGRSCATASG